MEEREEEGVTFAEIAKAIKRRLLLTVAVTLALTAAFVLAVVFLLDPIISSYSIEFTLTYPASDTQKFPDGSPFYYQDIISRDNLMEVRNADGAFARLNVDKMIARDGISIEAEKSAGEEAVYTGHYTLTVKASYFADRAQATSFLCEVARRPVNRAIQMARSIDYSLDETTFGNADFAGRIELLAQQRENILGQYEAWISLYRGSYVVSGKTLVNHRADVAVLFGEETESALLEELETNGYVPLDRIDERKQQLLAEYEENVKKIEELKSAMAGVPAVIGVKETSKAQETTSPLDLSQTLASLIVRNVQIQSRLSALTPENVQAFEARLTDAYQKLQNAAQNVQSVGSALFEQEARVYYSTTLAETRGGLNIAFAIVGGLVLFFLLTAFAVCSVELPRMRREREKAAAESGSGAEPEINPETKSEAEPEEGAADGNKQ